MFDDLVSLKVSEGQGQTPNGAKFRTYQKLDYNFLEKSEMELGAIIGIVVGAVVVVVLVVFLVFWVSLLIISKNEPLSYLTDALIQGRRELRQRLRQVVTYHW